MLLQESIEKLLRYFYYNIYKQKQSRNCSASKRVALHNCNNQETSTKD